MPVPGRVASVLVLFIAIAMAAGRVPASAGRLPAQSDLDQFMERVLARRDENWKRLHQYILDEREQVELRGPLNVPIWGQRREYTWYIREGFFVRSPRTADGVSVPDDERRRYEEDFLHRAKARDQQERERSADREGADADDAAVKPLPPAATPADMEAFLSQTRRPQFVDSAYFLRFKFEAGKYAFVGRETLDGLEVLRIEYYPTRLFAGDEDDERRKRERSDREKATSETIGRLMNKVALVTLWVEPNAHQIVKYTFDNLHLDFLPAAWLVRLDELQASMRMAQAFPGVWLPRDVDMQFGATMAAGSFTARYRIEYFDYREAATSGRIKSIVVP